mmetsp:Transcript_32869/g.61620  ORF Transcript_32869/g.61620 Transcript_32869/m.61620 type:complete len:313 (+) Transcript_32869:31-969(+)
MFSSELRYTNLEAEELCLGSHVLHLDASHGESSVIGSAASSMLSKLAHAYSKIDVQHLCLWDATLQSQMEYNLEHVKAKMNMLAGTGSESDRRKFAGIEVLAKQLATARGLVVSAPLWNFGVPYVVKQYFDSVLHPGLTFKEERSGPHGLLGGGRPFVLLTSSGGDAAKDYLTPWLLDVASMVGFDRPRVLSAANLVCRDRAAAIDAFKKEAELAVDHLLDKGTDTRHAAQCDGDEPSADCGHEELRSWLECIGGLSLDCVETLQAAHVNGELFLAASDSDWRDEELGLCEADIQRLEEVQAIFRALVGQDR